MHDLVAIRLFLLVAEERGFARAARHLGLSAAAATRRIAALEHDIATRLFFRSTRKVSLTDEGAVFRDYAQRIVDAADQARGALEELHAMPRGRLRVAARAALGLRLVVPYLAEFQRCYPDVTIGLELADEAVDIVAEGLDLGIEIGHLQSSSLIAKTLAVTKSVICASPGYLDTYGVPAEPAALADHRCLTFQARTGANTWHLSRGSEAVQVRIKGPIAVNNGDALKLAALDDLGIIMIADWLVHEELHNGALVPLFEDYTIEPRGTPITALYPSRTHLPPKVRVFIDFLADKYAALFASPLPDG